MIFYKYGLKGFQGTSKCTFSQKLAPQHLKNMSVGASKNKMGTANFAKVGNLLTRLGVWRHSGPKKLKGKCSKVMHYTCS